MEEEVKKVDLITLLRTFKKEGLDNFIVIRKEKFENNFIPKSKVIEKIEEKKQEKNKFGNCLVEFYENELADRDIKILQELLEE